MGPQTAMATLRMDKATRDPRTGILILRKRVPARYLGVAGLRGGFVKISSGTKDDKEARRRWPDVLRKYAAMEAEWEWRLNMVELTPATAAEIAAKWAAWIDAGHPLAMGGETSDVFEPMTLPETKTAGNVARMWDRVEVHAAEALTVAGVAVTEDSRPMLLHALLQPVAAAYLQADLTGLGVTGTAPAVNPLQTVRNALPAVAASPPPVQPGVSLRALLDAWKAVAVVKPRTVDEVAYAMALLETFLGHSDGSRITRDDMRRWREASKAKGLTNTTWNNRLSLVRQVFAFAVENERLPLNPADNALRLPKNRVATRLPYTDAEAARILLAARKEAAPSKRWAHWVMAFTGMRVAEVLQLTRGDIRQEGGIWFMAVHEDDAGKSVKTGERRNVPMHPALIAEGFLAYVQEIEGDAPVFPDKGLDKHGNRGGRGWNLVGKWARKVAGITDAAKAPNHSWRHRVEDDLRAAEVPEDVRDAIVGHARRTTGRLYGVRGEALARLHRGLAKLPVPAGVTPGA